MAYTLIPNRDYAKTLIWFEDIEIARAAKRFLDKKRINCVVLYNEIGFATNKTRLKSLELLKKAGYNGVLV